MYGRSVSGPSAAGYEVGSADMIEPKSGSRVPNLHLLRSILLLLAVAVIGLAVLDYNGWKAERRLGSALGEVNNHLRELAESVARLSDEVASLSSAGTLHSPADIDIDANGGYETLDQNWHSVRDTSDRTKVPCEVGPKTAIIVTLGQSNAANTGPVTYTPTRDVLNFDLYDGNCYQARDPLLGASGSGGNFATILADRLIADGAFDRVIVAPIAMGGTTIEQWADEGRFRPRILVLVRRLFDAGLKPTYILWHQGENNAGEGDLHGRQYRMRLLEVVSTFRRYGIAAPFFVALATKCGPYPRPGSDSIREGQRSAVNPLMNVFLGPDTDQLGDDYRGPQHCHFNAGGMQRHAAMWAQLLESWAAAKSGG